MTRGRTLFFFFFFLLLLSLRSLSMLLRPALRPLIPACLRSTTLCTPLCLRPEHTALLVAARSMSASGDGRDESTFTFGPLSIPATHVFARTPLSYAFVNLKPVVPGHVLVSPRRPVPRLHGLTPAETADLFTLAARVAAAVEPHFAASSITLAVQDGADAGQTVPHVHVHVLPRKGGDFERNDDVYTALERKGGPAGSEPVVPDKGAAFGSGLDPDAPRRARTGEEMAEEAALLRTLL